eukprot:6488847-Amphidinium_carterae.1
MHPKCTNHISLAVAAQFPSHSTFKSHDACAYIHVRNGFGNDFHSRTTHHCRKSDPGARASAIRGELKKKGTEDKDCEQASEILV